MEKNISVQITLEPQVQFYGDQNSSKTLLALHGFQQTGLSFYKLIKEAIPQDYKVIVPNALFLTPIQNKKSGHFEEAYAWYHYSIGEDKYYTPYTPSLDYLKQLLKFEGGTEVTILGYSQGAYIAPSVGEQTPSIKNVICVNGSYRKKHMPNSFNYKLTALHGIEDKIVDYTLAKSRFETWTSNIPSPSKFISLPETHHRWTPKISKEVHSLLNT